MTGRAHALFHVRLRNVLHHCVKPGKSDRMGQPGCEAERRGPKYWAHRLHENLPISKYSACPFEFLILERGNLSLRVPF
jgi:hypothetical protein